MLKDNMANTGLRFYDEGIAGDLTGTMTFHDNVVVNQRGAGIFIGGTISAPVHCYNNLLIHCGKGPAFPANDPFISCVAFNLSGWNRVNQAKVKFYNNTIYGYSDAAMIAEPSATVAAIYIDNTNGGFDGTLEWVNNIMVDLENIRWLGNTRQANYAAGNIWYNGGDGNPAAPPAWDATAKTTDPIFVNAANNDFHLAAGSPGINTGRDTVLSIVKADIFGVPRTAGQVEIGAIETEGITGIISSVAGNSRGVCLTNQPNPFKSFTVIKAGGILPEINAVFNIYDLNGKLVRTQNVKAQTLSSGIIWNGRDRNGSLLSAASYFCQIKAGEKTYNKKMILSKN